MAQVSVTIAGRAYRMACADGEERRLADLARALDEKIANLRTEFGEIGDQRLIVMSALSIADQLEETRQSLARAQDELEAARGELRSEQNQSAIGAMQIASALEQASERIERLARTVATQTRDA